MTIGAAAADGAVSLADQLDAAQHALDALQERLTPQHPDVIRAQKQVRDLSTKLAAAPARPPSPAAPVRVSAADTARQLRLRNLQAELQNVDRQIMTKEAEEKRLRAVMASYQTRVEAAPTRESELIELTRDYTTIQQLYTSLLGKREDSKIAANLERRQAGEQFRILDPARMPERPFSPNRIRINLMGAIAGLGLGLGLVALLEYRDTTLRTDDDVMVAISLPVLAMIPLMVTTVEERLQTRRRWLMAGTTAAALAVSVAILLWKVTGR